MNLPLRVQVAEPSSGSSPRVQVAELSPMQGSGRRRLAGLLTNPKLQTLRNAPVAAGLPGCRPELGLPNAASPHLG